MAPHYYAKLKHAVIYLAAATALAAISWQLAPSQKSIDGYNHESLTAATNKNKGTTTTTTEPQQPSTTLSMFHTHNDYSSDDENLQQLLLPLLHTNHDHDDYSSSPNVNVVLSSSFPTPELHVQFRQWKSQHSKNYGTRREHAQKKLIWLMNHEYIERHNNNNNNNNSNNRGYELAHNEFSDLTHLEFQQRFFLGEYSPGVLARQIISKEKNTKEAKDIIRIRSDTSSAKLLVRANNSTTTFTSRMRELSNHLDLDFGENAKEEDVSNVVDAKDNIPRYKNWVEEGAVTSVKNQLFCGACWAFSAVGAIEGARYIKTGNLTDLSMQQLIDCDFADFGCHGGLMDQAFQYDQDTNVGLCSLQDYPFAYHRHWFNGCRRYMPYCTPLRDSRVEKFVDVNKTEEDLKAAIALQPVAVAVSAGIRDWQFYSKGIFGKGCSEEVDHAVLAVGYGHYDPQSDTDATSDNVGGDYWLVKNSWGAYWGMKGYIQLARGTGNEAEGGSSCILTLASRPILKVEE